MPPLLSFTKNQIITRLITIIIMSHTVTGITSRLWCISSPNCLHTTHHHPRWQCFLSQLPAAWSALSMCCADELVSIRSTSWLYNLLDSGIWYAKRIKNLGRRTWTSLHNIVELFSKFNFTVHHSQIKRLFKYNALVFFRQIFGKVSKIKKKLSYGFLETFTEENII